MNRKETSCISQLNTEIETSGEGVPRARHDICCSRICYSNGANLRSGCASLSARSAADCDAVEKLFPDMLADEQTALWQSKEVLYREISTKMTPLPGLMDFLERCEAAGLVMIVVTNAPRIDAVHTLKVLGLYERRVLVA